MDEEPEPGSAKSGGRDSTGGRRGSQRPYPGRDQGGVEGPTSRGRFAWVRLLARGAWEDPDARQAWAGVDRHDNGIMTVRPDWTMCVLQPGHHEALHSMSSTTLARARQPWMSSQFR